MSAILRTIPLLLLLLFAGTAATAKVNLVEESELAPTTAQLRATRLITYFISNYHYKPTGLDDALSASIFKRYLENLDPNRSFFTAADIATIDRHRTQFDDYLDEANLDVVFEIFKLYRKRVVDRVAYARGLLDSEFNFERDEEYRFDRSEAPWADAAGLDELWRQRVKNDVLGLRLAGKDREAISKTLNTRYEGIERRTRQLNADDVFQFFINAYTTTVEPHTSYFSPRTSENFRIRMSLSLEGIGAVLQSEDEYTLVREVVPGGPADKSGRLDADDRIIGVGQGASGDVVDVVGWRLDDVVDLIRGPKGSVVRLDILPKGVGPEGPSRVITITRNKISLEEQAAKSDVLTMELDTGNIKLGIINVPAFYMDFEARARGDRDYRSTTRDVRKLLQELRAQNVDGIVIDLRGNGGGSLTEATELTGLFIKTGPVVQVRSADGRIQVERDVDPGIEYAGPMAVLVDRYSASASEIFAGAIQDYRRGIILGEPTFGKGTVQNLVDLSRLDRRGDAELGQLKATIAQFFRVAGASTQHRGVVPDIVFPTAAYADDFGERGLDNALPWDQVKPAKFVPVTNNLGALPLAVGRHERRIAGDDGFRVLLEQAERIREAQDKKTLSLVESRRRAEQDRAEAEQRATENRLRAAIGLAPLPPLPEGDGDAKEEALDAARKELDEALEKPENDLVLKEAARILADLLAGPDVLKALLEDAVPGYADRGSTAPQDNPALAAP